MRQIKHSSILIALGSFGLLAWGICAYYLTYKNLRFQENKLQTERVGQYYLNRFNEILENSIFATRMLAFAIEHQEDDDVHFELIARDILNRTENVDALQLLQGTTIIKTYPIEGNEAVIGFDISENQFHFDHFIEAQARNELYFEGPFELKQGGCGIVGRHPIYKNGQFWGMAAVIIRCATLTQALGMDSTGIKDGYGFTLSKSNKSDSSYSHLFKFEPYSQTVAEFNTSIAIGDWKLQVAKIESSPIDIHHVVLILSLLISAISCGFLWYALEQPKRLTELVNQRTNQLHEANRQLQLKNNYLNQFLFITSHNIQEPIRRLMTFSGKLSLTDSSGLNEKTLRQLSFIEESANQLNSLVKELELFTSIGYADTTNTKKHVDLNAVIHKIRQENHALLNPLHIELSSSQNLHSIWANDLQALTLLKQLVNYSMRFPREKNVRTKIQLRTERTPSETILIYSDNGIKLDGKYHDKLFNLFQRFDGNGGEAGIGLALVKLIMENHHGRISVESEESCGISFNMYFPNSPVDSTS
jgi:signal transduction histidine kinase/sensor domain CHASE-containing protein